MKTMKEELERVFGVECSIVYEHDGAQTVALDGWPEAITYRTAVALSVLGTYRDRAGITEEGDAAVCLDLEQHAARIDGDEEAALVAATEAENN